MSNTNLHFDGLVLHIPTEEAFEEIKALLIQQEQPIAQDGTFSLIVEDGIVNPRYTYLAFYQHGAKEYGWWIGPKMDTDKEVTLDEFKRLLTISI